jgi:hypothetical protein
MFLMLIGIFWSLSTARLAQSDRASDSYGGRGVALRLQSEGCEFDPRGGLVHDLFTLSASLATSSEFAEDCIRDIKRRTMRIRIFTVYQDVLSDKAED